MKTIFRILILILLTAILDGCKKDIPTLPVLKTTEATEISATSAKSGGSITSDGGSPILAQGVCWSTGVEPTTDDSKTDDALSTVSFISNITSLEGGTLYYIRAYATNVAGTGYGTAMSFTTLGQAPTVSTVTATNITTQSVILSGTVNANYLPTVVSFEYGTTISYGSEITATQSPITGNSNTIITADLSGISPGTTYHFRIKSVNSRGTVLGSDMIFTTLGQAPIATTQSATNITTTSVTLNGIARANYLSTTVSFEYGATITYGSIISATQSPITGISNTSISANLTDLLVGTTYHYRLKTENVLGIIYGNDQTFTTLGNKPTVTTQTPTNLTTESATLNGSVNSNYLTTTISFEWGTTTSYGHTLVPTQSPVTGNSNITVNTSITGLAPGTIYHFRIKAENTMGISLGNDVSFTTLGNIPLIVAPLNSGYTTTTADLTALINPNYLSTTVTYEWGTTNSYGNTITPVQSPINGGSAANILVSLINLLPGTTYHFRVVAQNSLGISNSDDATFTTLGKIPTAVIQPATNLNTTSVTLNGSVNPNYLSTTVTFEWGTTPSYGNTITATQSPVSVGYSTNISAVLSGLTKGTIYHARIYAINILGAVYSDDITFTTSTVAIGESYQGGIVAYVLQPGDPGHIDGETHGLIAAPNDQGSAPWGCYEIAISGADGTALGTGNQNTTDIINGCSTAGIAARICYDLVLNGYSDWYLPSKDELNKLFLNRSSIGGFVPNNSYWSSSEYSDQFAWRQVFYSDVTQYYTGKPDGYSFRAVRSF